ncbi:MAG: histidine phosphatase family protein [Sphingomonadales bacterium]
MSDRPAPTRWYWVRHAPVIDATGELYDTPAEPADVSDSEAFQGLARSLPRDAIWLTSNLQCAHQTANAIAAAGNAPANRMEDSRLAEQHFGDWFGKADEADFKAERKKRSHNFWMVDAATRPPGGESFLDLYARVCAAIDSYSAQFQGQTLVAVSHGGVIRAALAYALGLEADKALSIMVEHLSTTRVDYYPGPGKGGDWRTVFVNKRAR